MTINFASVWCGRRDWCRPRRIREGNDFMKHNPKMLALLFPLALASGACMAEGSGGDRPTQRESPAPTLESWTEGGARQTIEAFVQEVSTPGSATFVAPEERIAVFDNDGTLWAEQPMYFQLLFALDRVRTVVQERSELLDNELVRAIVDGDNDRIGAMTHADIFDVIAVSHAGGTVEEFQEIVSDWLDTARDPRFGRRFDELLYQPQLELLDYLHAHDFRVFIVSGGGIDFLRVFAEQAYGIPPERVVGSSLKGTLEVRDGRPVIVKGTEVSSIDDGPEKPVNINLHIGRRPILAFGNSDGDLQMLEYTDDGDGPALALILRHDDAVREWEYDRESSIGRLDRALDVAAERGWTVVSIRDDFQRVFSFDR
jgi:phosphoglycolate phosphatase-like HAD superfamily hydrolase